MNIFLWLLIFLQKLSANNICDPNSPKDTCTLISLDLKEDLVFTFPKSIQTNSYAIKGKDVQITCNYPCHQIIFILPDQAAYEVLIDLDSTKIYAERIKIKIKGNLVLKNSEFNTDNTSNLIKYDNDCITTSGYCFNCDDKVIIKPIKITDTIAEFIDFIRVKDISKLELRRGLSSTHGLKGGGQIIIYTTQLSLDNSLLSSKGQNNQKTKDSTECIISGTGGYVYIVTNHFEVNIQKEQKLISVAGNCYDKKTSEISSSSSGHIFIKYTTIKDGIFYSKKTNMDHNLKNDSLPSDFEKIINIVETNSNCYTSSTGFMYIENDDSNILSINYSPSENVSRTILNDTNNYINSFKFNLSLKKDSYSLTYLYVNNINIKLTSINDNKPFKNIVTHNSSYEILIANTNSLWFIDGLISTESKFTHRGCIIIINNLFTIEKAELMVRAIVINDKTPILRSSKIDCINNENNEIGILPNNLNDLFDMNYIIENSEQLYKYYFICMISEESIDIIDRTSIKTPIFLAKTNQMGISSDSVVQGIFLSLAEYRNFDRICGLQGTHNAGLGYLSFEVDNDFCLDGFIKSNMSLIENNLNDKPSISTTPKYTSTSEYVSPFTYVKSGGIIKIIGKVINLEGKLSVEGFPSTKTDKIITSATAAGSIYLLFDKYNFVENSIVNIMGGIYNERNGPGGGGKIVLSLKSNEESKINFENFIITNDSKITSVTDYILFKYSNAPIHLRDTQIFSTEPMIKGYVIDIAKRLYYFIRKIISVKNKKNINNIKLNKYSAKKDFYLPNAVTVFYNQNRNKFSGKIINLEYCKPGFTTPLCLPCPSNTFKPFYGIDACIPCPCALSTDPISTAYVSVSDCQCKNISIFQLYFLEIIIIFGILVSFVVYNVQAAKIKSERRQSEILLRTEDLVNIKYKINCKGINIPNSPFRISPHNLTFIDNPTNFTERFNQITEFLWIEKVILYALFLLNLSPLYYLVLYAFKLNKIGAIKKHLLKYTFIYLDIEDKFVLKYTLSANYSHLTLYFVKIKDNTPSYAFELDFPYIIPIVGIGNFHYQFKLNLNDPYLVYFIKFLKRSIDYEKMNVNSFIPVHLLNNINTNSKKSENPNIDYFLSYLNLLLSTIQFNIPKEKLKERLIILKNYITELNGYLSAYGFKFLILLDLNDDHTKFTFDFLNEMFTKVKLLHQIQDLFPKNEGYIANLVLKIVRVRRSKPLSIIFEKADSINPSSPLKDATRFSLPSIKKNYIQGDKNKIFSKLANEAHDVLLIKVFYMIKVYINDTLIVNLWKFFAYHDCRGYKYTYKGFVVIFYLLIIVIQLILSKDAQFNSYTFYSLFPPVFIDQINIMLFILQLVINKSKLEKLMVYSSFVSFIKSFIIGAIFLLGSDSSVTQYFSLYWINAVACLFICFSTCFNLSLHQFEKNHRTFSRIN